jgi:hypothetical protein
VGVGNVGRELLEELFVDGIEKILFFSKVAEASAGFFAGLVIGIESLEEIGLRETILRRIWALPLPTE